MPSKRELAFRVSCCSLTSINRPISYKLTNRKCSKIGVSHTYLIGVSHTPCCGVSHTDFEVMGVYKMTKRSRGGLLTLIPLSAGLDVRLLCEQEPAHIPIP